MTSAVSRPARPIANTITFIGSMNILSPPTPCFRYSSPNLAWGCVA